MVGFLLVSIGVLFALFVGALNYLDADPPGRMLTLDEVRLLSQQGRLVKGTILYQDELLIGTFTSRAEAIAPVAMSATVRGSTAPARPLPSWSDRITTWSPVRLPEAKGRFHVRLSSNAALAAGLEHVLRAGGAQFEVDRQGVKKQVRLATTFLLPLMILANLCALLFATGRGESSAMGAAINFGQIGNRKDLASILGGPATRHNGQTNDIDQGRGMTYRQRRQPSAQ